MTVCKTKPIIIFLLQGDWACWWRRGNHGMTNFCSCSHLMHGSGSRCWEPHLPLLLCSSCCHCTHHLETGRALILIASTSCLALQLSRSVKIIMCTMLTVDAFQASNGLCVMSCLQQNAPAMHMGSQQRDRAAFGYAVTFTRCTLLMKASMHRAGSMRWSTVSVPCRFLILFRF